MFKDMIATAIYTNAFDRLTKAAKKNGVDVSEFDAIVAAIRSKHFKEAQAVQTVLRDAK